MASEAGVPRTHFFLQVRLRLCDWVQWEVYQEDCDYYAHCTQTLAPHYYNTCVAMVHHERPPRKIT
jgi:hypothetical protein